MARLKRAAAAVASEARAYLTAKLRQRLLERAPYEGPADEMIGPMQQHRAWHHNQLRLAALEAGEVINVHGWELPRDMQLPGPRSALFTLETDGRIRLADVSY